ncbi:DUF4065 domain-containing protein [Roseobacter sp. HKCCD9010]|uniref:Panacea domain-containing protein n=1 Tax=unclassified Roseobacter TaxID=196798 RepID=UPI00149159CD|nr:MULTISPECIES: type II toxin-antitoxin system antitoxin SocA domain-containing protein [unclassified Roseobacter]MBF9050661.1 DUF4065 domain-containing protein [Rhodobacterales bacterium HKCCD4356]NNV11921.1 DUF4065 domain-containing protein [Roseobacter sp. HKCCD7357]NNV16934.1 DUF4065 domain-containing protein [Roseobacter sp. HKCCD8768]NNV26163.1 DUF4065 domain-containing protein [Roseobacter sp. HKCCD8192]NNV30655.1 DUF4065 domain-containing protein [Roseobacter sp. HKCCD9061]
MAINVQAAARHMSQRSGWTLSNLQLQKLIYLAHMFYLGRTGGDPLVNGHFEAWDYGPVHPELYHRAKVFGAHPVKDVFSPHPSVAGTPEAELLDEAYDALGSTRPGQLVNATHREGGAWAINYIPGTRRIPIPNTDILAEYNGMESD